MTGHVFDHVGIVVEDIADARQRMSDALHIRFSRVVSTRVENWDLAAQGPMATDLRVCYSIDGPPHYELIEQTTDGIWGPAEVGRIHHVGYTEADPGERLAQLSRAGVQCEASYRSPEDGRLYVVYTEPSGLCGARIELLSSEIPPFLEKYGYTGT